VIQLAQGAPQIYDLPELHREMIEVLGVKNAKKLIPMQDDMKPKDPLTENMDAMTAKPLKAFIYQDQDAHIAAHMNFLQDPQTAAMIGQNPAAQQITGALQAHIAEHFAFKYRLMIEQQIGASLPPPNEELPEEYEIQVSRLVAQASQQVLQNNQAQAAQQQAAEQAQDPIIQMQQEELAIKDKEVERKKAKDQADFILKQQQQQIECERIASQEEIEGTKLGVKIAKDKEEFEYKQEYEGTKLGVEIARNTANRKVNNGNSSRDSGQPD
jgi:hypothetical protein